MGRRGYWRQEQAIEVSTAMRDGAQAESLLRRETGTATRTEEEESLTERAVTTGKEERATQSQNETCTEGEHAPAT